MFPFLWSDSSLLIPLQDTPSCITTCCTWPAFSVKYCSTSSKLLRQKPVFSIRFHNCMFAFSLQHFSAIPNNLDVYHNRHVDSFYISMLNPTNKALSFNISGWWTSVYKYRMLKTSNGIIQICLYILWQTSKQEFLMKRKTGTHQREYKLAQRSCSHQNDLKLGAKCLAGHKYEEVLVCWDTS